MPDAIRVALCAWDEVPENPVPENACVSFVRGDLAHADVMTRACVAASSYRSSSSSRMANGSSHGIDAPMSARARSRAAITRSPTWAGSGLPADSSSSTASIFWR